MTISSALVPNLKSDILIMFIVHEWTTSDVTSGKFTTFSFGAGTTILRHFNMNNNINTSFYIAIAKHSIAEESLFYSSEK